MSAADWRNGLKEAVERLREHFTGPGPRPGRFDARDRNALAFVLQHMEAVEGELAARAIPQTPAEPETFAQLGAQVFNASPARPQTPVVDPGGDECSVCLHAPHAIGACLECKCTVGRRPRASTGRAVRPARSLVHEAFHRAVEAGGNNVCACSDTTSWHQACCDALTEALEADRARLFTEMLTAARLHAEGLGRRLALSRKALEATFMALSRADRAMQLADGGFDWRYGDFRIEVLAAIEKASEALTDCDATGVSHNFADCITKDGDKPCRDCAEYAHDAVGAPAALDTTPVSSPPLGPACYCGKPATVFRTGDGAKWCDDCSPYARYVLGSKPLMSTAPEKDTGNNAPPVDFAATPPPGEQPPSKPRTCNRHSDCDAANAKAKAAGRFSADHCHDDCCEDCFGS